MVFKEMGLKATIALALLVPALILSVVLVLLADSLAKALQACNIAVE